VRVVIDENNANMELVVPDAKLSLAIGRRGQNVRLASQLTGWKLDIVSEARFKQIEEDAMDALARVGGPADIARNLYKMGFRSLDEVAEASEGELASVDGVNADTAGAVKERAAGAMEAFRKERLAALRDADELPSERERLLLVA